MLNRIGELRREKGLTLKKMGSLLDIKDNTLSQYETGKREPQLGLLKEIADFFDVSLDYLICETDKRDYPVNNDDEALNLLKMFKEKEITYSNISNLTAINLAMWIGNNAKKINTVYTDLSFEADNFARNFLMETKILKWYKEERKEITNTIEIITSILENEDEYNGATPSQVLDFINISQNISYEEIEKTIEYMKGFERESEI